MRYREIVLNHIDFEKKLIIEYCVMINNRILHFNFINEFDIKSLI